VSGYDVVACDRSVEALERAQLYVRDGIGRFARKGVITEDEAGTAYNSIHLAVNAEEMGEAEAVIEAVVERLGPKKVDLGALDALLSPGSLLLTNTSFISITDLASATGRPERICGAHFFTPPPLRVAVEIPRGLLRSDETVERVKELVTSFGKLPVVVRKDIPGFVANRFLMPMLIEVARLLEEGVASKEEIDLLVKKEIRFPSSGYTTT
jgi:3-hydroxybutyryl-CoA dehydrogenase